MYPTKEELTVTLHDIQQAFMGYDDIESVDVRLQVLSGGWSTHTGDSSYDQDHRGFWGASSISKHDTIEDLEDIAEDLISQAKEQEAYEDQPIRTSEEHTL